MIYRYEPFILAMQASQVVFLPYPSLRRTNSNWVSVCKIKPRWIVDTTDQVDNSQVSDKPFQDDEQSLLDVEILDANDGLGPLHDPSGEVVEVDALSDEEECHEDEDIEFESSTLPVDEDAEDNSNDD